MKISNRIEEYVRDRIRDLTTEEYDRAVKEDETAKKLRYADIKDKSKSFSKQVIKLFKDNGIPLDDDDKEHLSRLVYKNVEQSNGSYQSKQSNVVRKQNSAKQAVIDALSTVEHTTRAEIDALIDKALKGEEE